MSKASLKIFLKVSWISNSLNTVSFELAESLIHVTERLSVPKPVTDPHFNVVVHAAKLKRVVEMLQWVETEHRRDVTNDNGETVTEYSYDYTQVSRMFCDAKLFRLV